jgi:hypothetical protein
MDDSTNPNAKEAEETAGTCWISVASAKRVFTLHSAVRCGSLLNLLADSRLLRLAKSVKGCRPEVLAGCAVARHVGSAADPKRTERLLGDARPAHSSSRWFALLC